jgi:xylulokinase
VVREKTVGASYGDAFIAALAVGDVSPGDIQKWNPVAREIVPNAALRSVYEKQYRTFRELYPRTKELMRS